MIHAEAESHALPGYLTTHFPAVFVEIATLPPAPGMMDSTKLPSDRCKPVGGQSRNWFEILFSEQSVALYATNGRNMLVSSRSPEILVECPLRPSGYS